MEPEDLQTCQDRIGHEFADPALLSLALTHASVAATRLDSNERLEFLGDAVLGLVVCEELYRLDSDLQEGEMTKIKSSVVSRNTCAQVATDSEISDLLVLGKGMNGSGGPPMSVAAAVFESIIGAIYLDAGLDAARQFILGHVRPYIDEALEDRTRNNYKSLLQQHVQREWSLTPEYHVLDEKGPDHSKCFEVAVSVNGNHFRSAWGMSKKEAEQEAAKLALVEMGVLDETDLPDAVGQAREDAQS